MTEYDDSAYWAYKPMESTDERNNITKRFIILFTIWQVTIYYLFSHLLYLGYYDISNNGILFVSNTHEVIARR